MELNFRLPGDRGEHQVVERASPRIRSHRRQRRRRSRIGARASKCVRAGVAGRAQHDCVKDASPAQSVAVDRGDHLDNSQ